MAKNQQLIPEMRSSATDTGDKAFASADSDLQPSCPVLLCCRGCNRFSNAIFHLTNYKTLTVNNFLSSIFWEVRNFWNLCQFQQHEEDWPFFIIHQSGDSYEQIRFLCGEEENPRRAPCMRAGRSDFLAFFVYFFGRCKKVKEVWDVGDSILKKLFKNEFIN